MPLRTRLSNCLRIADSLCTAGGSRRTLLTFYLCFLFCLCKTATHRSKFAFQTVCVLPTVCVRRAALAAPFRQCAGSNSPFKPLVHFCTSSDGERLSPHPFNILYELFAYIKRCAIIFRCTIFLGSLAKGSWIATSEAVIHTSMFSDYFNVKIIPV